MKEIFLSNNLWYKYIIYLFTFSYISLVFVTALELNHDIKFVMKSVKE